MTSTRHNNLGASPQTPTSEDSYLDAAREAILAVGWSRTTLTDIARRAGVSRMTLYRRWPDTGTLLADLMTREWSRVVETATRASERSPGTPEQLSRTIVATVRALRADPLLRRIVEVDPEVLLPYLLQRRGRSQQSLLDALTVRLADSQRTGLVRGGDTSLMARTILLACHGFVLSAHTMVATPDDGPAEHPTGPALDPLDDELGHLLESFLEP